MEKTPLTSPPPGVTPDYVNPESRADTVSACFGACVSIIILFAVARLYAKMTVLERTWDDVTCALGVLAGIIYMVLGLALVKSKNAYGIHVWNLTYEDMPAELLQLVNVYQSIYSPLIWLVKLSLFVLFIRIFQPFTWLRYSAWIGAILTGIFYFSVMIVYAIVCTPKPHGDHSSLGITTVWTSPRCRNIEPIFITTGCVNVVSDLYLIVLPLPAVWKLQLPRRRKIAISFMFMTGAIACLASILGLQFRASMSNGWQGDVTWNSVPAIIYANVEITAGIAVCCMPATATVFNHFRNRFPSLRSFKSFKVGSAKDKLSSLSPKRLKDTSGSSPHLSDAGHSWIELRKDDDVVPQPLGMRRAVVRNSMENFV